MAPATKKSHQKKKDLLWEGLSLKNVILSEAKDLMEFFGFKPSE
jgi:hypothetical protein